MVIRIFPPSPGPSTRRLAQAFRVPIAALLFLMLLACPEPPDPFALADAGREALAAGRHEEGRNLLYQAYQALPIESSTLRAELLFDIARTYQLEAEAAAEAGEPDWEKLRTAAGIYRMVREREPSSASILLHLGQVEEALAAEPEGARPEGTRPEGTGPEGTRPEGARGGGRSPELRLQAAEEAFRLAAEIPGEQQLESQLEFARFLKDHGQWPRAATIYEGIALAGPHRLPAEGTAAAATDPHAILLEHYLDFEENGPAPLLTYLRRLIAAGQVSRARTATLRALGQEATSEAGDELLAILASCLVEEVPDPETFSDSPLDHSLAELGGDREIGPGATELRRLFVAIRGRATGSGPGERLGWADFPWWGRQGNRARETFQELAASLGAELRQETPERREQPERNALGGPPRQLASPARGLLFEYMLEGEPRLLRLDLERAVLPWGFMEDDFPTLLEQQVASLLVHGGIVPKGPRGWLVLQRKQRVIGIPYEVLRRTRGS